MKTYFRLPFKVILIFTVLFFALSCNKSTEQLVTLYFSDNDSMYFVPINTKITLEGELDRINKKNTESILQKLKTAVPPKGLRQSILKEITFSDIEVNSDKKEISLKINSNGKKLGDEDEQIMLGSVVNTLTDLNEINSVKASLDIKTNMDYSEAFTKESYRNSFMNVGEIEDKNPSTEVVYWFSRDKRYYIPVSIQIPKKDVTSLLKALKKGPQGAKKEYFTNTIDENIDILIKSVNLHNIDIELKGTKDLTKDDYEVAKKAILLSINDLGFFETVKFITAIGEEHVIDLKKENPKKTINIIENLSE